MLSQTSLPETLPESAAEIVDTQPVLIRKRHRHPGQRLLKYLIFITCSLVGLLILFTAALLLIYFLMAIFTHSPLN